MSVRGFNTGSGVEQYDYEYLDNKPEIPTKKSDIGLGNVDNTSDLDKPISNATQTALNEKVPNTRKVNGKALSADVSITSEDIGYDASTAYGSGTVGKELTDLNRQISESITPAIEEIETALDVKAPVIINTASGDIASFADGADGMPVKSLVANIEPVQDLHGYDNPWPAGGGINKMPAAPQSSGTVNGLTYTSDGNGKYTISGTSAAGDTITFYLEKNATLISGGKLSLFNNISGSINLFFNLDGTDQTYWALALINRTATIAQADAKEFNRIKIIFYSAGSVNLSLSPMIYEGDTQTTFSPYSNICPISGHTECTIGVVGVNWLPDNLTFTDGLRDDNGGQTSSAVSHYSEPFPIKPNTTYTASGVIRVHTTNPRIYFLDKNKNWISRTDQYSVGVFTFTTPENCYYIQVQCSKDVDLTAGMISTDQTASVTPYVENTAISISWQTEAGTVYGGTLDVTNGVLTVDKKGIVYDGSTDENWERFQSGSAGAYAMRISATDISLSASGVNVMSNYLPAIEGSAAWGSYDYFVAGTSLPSIYTGIRSITTVDAWRAYLAQNNLQVVYKLATPITYQLTPKQLDTLLGSNNIWTDVGTVDVEYPADTKLYIEQLTKPTEDDMTADHAISAGTFFMVGNSLYLATSQIAAGGTITPGTNATQLSLADALNQLNT